MKHFWAVIAFLGSAGGAEPAQRRVIAQHDYDPVSDAVVSWSLLPGEAVAQSFALPRAGPVRGFRVKLQRWGNPAPLEFRIGTRLGSADLAAGAIRGEISPWFEHWYGADFSTPLRMKPSPKYYLQLRLAKSSRGNYEVFGTSTHAVSRSNFHSRFEYTENWNPSGRVLSVFENPANIDYGMRTPRYEAGSAFDSVGTEIAPLDFAFRILGSAPGDPPCEEPFTFVEDITGPLYTGALRDAHSHPEAGEMEVGEGWTLVYPANSGEMVKIAAGELQQFLKTGMSVSIGIEAAQHPAAKPRTIVAGARREFPGFAAGLKKSEAFRLKVGPDRVVACGYDERGVLQALHYLEAAMRMRRAPVLKTGEELREPAHSPRITSAPFYSKSELEAPVDPYTEGLLGRISRGGFNAIWVWGDLNDVAHSSVYPELDRGVAARQGKLNGLIGRAARYGIDVYMYLANPPLPEAFFAGHPEVRGSEFHAYGGAAVLCTSTPEVRRHLTAAVRNLMEKVPKLRGIVFIVGGEGFLHCYTRRNTCPRCRRRLPQDTIAEFSAALLEGARAGNPEAVVAAWPYSASNTWSRTDTTQSGLIAKLPPGITLLTEFAKEGTVSAGGISIPAYDYPICITGPSDRFVEQAKLAAARDLAFWTTTEHATTYEFVDTPYIPVFFQWGERFERIRRSPGVAGVFANWMHYGFVPSRAADLYYWHSWTQPADDRTLLARIARRDFGPGTEPYALRAWSAFSEAIRQYPFSGAMCMGVVQKGPAHPLFFDPQYRPEHGHGRQFKNDLSWTRPWGPELTIRQFSAMERLWADGVAELRQAVAKAAPDRRRDAMRELGVAQALLAQIRSVIHIARFYMLREQLPAAPDKTRAARVLEEMAAVANAELHNAESALPAVCADSRLGYANSGNNDQEGVPRAGVYSAGSIEKKIAQLARLLREDIPEYRRKHGLAK